MEYEKPIADSHGFGFSQVIHVLDSDLWDVRQISDWGCSFSGAAREQEPGPHSMVSRVLVHGYLEPRKSFLDQKLMVCFAIFCPVSHCCIWLFKFFLHLPFQLQLSLPLFLFLIGICRTYFTFCLWLFSLSPHSHESRWLLWSLCHSCTHVHWGLVSLCRFFHCKKRQLSPCLCTDQL